MTTTETTATVKIGDIYSASWGYDETRVDFYEVVGLTPSGKSVKIRKIAAETVDSTGGPVEHVRPIPGAFVKDEILTKRIKDGYIKITSYAWAFPTTATELHYITGFGWGR